MVEPGNNRVYVIILNWNTWEETIACLESVLKLDYKDYGVVICDNHSKNDSVDKLSFWLDGKDLLDMANDKRADLLIPYCQKPQKYRVLRESEMDDAGYVGDCITIIRNSENYGYAGGNNVGIRYAMGDPCCSAVWILNNDVVVTEKSLQNLVASLDNTIGIVGSKVLNYYDGGLQFQGGGVYSKITGKSRIILGKTAKRPDKLDYISGCSMLLSRELVQNVGYLSTEYFLYYEELDLAIRSREKGYTLKYADNSVVYHKRGATIGTSASADFYIIRSRMMVTRKFFHFYYPSILLSVFMTACVRVGRGQWKRAYMIILLMLNPGMSYQPSRWDG